MKTSKRNRLAEQKRTEKAQRMKENPNSNSTYAIKKRLFPNPGMNPNSPFLMLSHVLENPGKYNVSGTRLAELNAEEKNDV